MKFLPSFLLSFLIASSGLFVTSFAQTLAEVAANNNLNTLIAAATATGQLLALQGTTDLTLFGPTDAAFQAAFPGGGVEWLLRNENLGILGEIVAFHVLPGVVRTVDLSDGLEQNGKTFVRNPSTGGYTVNGATIGPANLAASNGVLHIINQVLLPPDLPALPSNIVQMAQAEPNFSSLVQAIQVAGLTNALTSGTVTVFAPTNAAFSQLSLGAFTFLSRFPTLMGQVLLYHVAAGAIPSSSLTNGQQIPTLLDGQSLQVVLDNANNVTLLNGVAAIETADVEALNGFIHVIDSVLVPPGLTISPSVSDVATEIGQFNSLLLAVEAANLGAALNVPGPLTVFAPTDNAFAKVPNLNSILANNDLLQLILTYHVVPGRLLTTQLAVGQSQTLTTLASQTLTITKLANGAVTINGIAQVVISDVEASNGVLHGINEVLIPDTSTPTPPDTPTMAPMAAGTPTMPTVRGTVAPTSGSSAAGRSLFAVALSAVGSFVVVMGWLM